MRRKPLVLLTMAALLLLVAMAFAPGAFAGTLTKIMYAQENITYYTYTPTTTGTLHVALSWTNPDGTGAPLFPVAEIDGVVQTYDSKTGELYYDIDVAGLYSGTNPQSGDVPVAAGGVNNTIYVGVTSYVEDVPYHITATWTPTGGSATTVINQTGMAYASSGEAYVPSTAGSWLSVLQTWPGSLNRSTGVSNVWANWDDYVWSRAEAGAVKMTDNYSVEYVPPIVTPVNNISANLKGRWYNVGPEIWTAAAVPNVWTDISLDQYPKPGSLPYTGTNSAPAWFTYAYTDSAISDANTKPGYMWPNVTSASASQRNFSAEAATSATLTYNFYGTSLKWIYTKGPRAGIASVKIDGAEAGPVDQYAAAVTYKQSTTFSGLSAGNHTVVIKSTGTKNSASSGLFVYHDTFATTTDSADPTPNSENNYDGSTTYAWGKVNTASASGGSFSFNSATSSALAFTFSGTSIQWTYVKGPRAGIANVWIDGVAKPSVDQYASAVTYGASTTFSGLSNAVHTILIKSTTTKNAASSGLFTYHDAFVVGGVTYQD
jgi:hypothetical protein